MVDHALNECAYCSALSWCRKTPKGPMCRACHVVRFFQRILFAPIGLKLITWQEKFLRDVYGTCNIENGERVYEKAFALIPKKNGKSFLVGGCPIYHLVGEGVENPKAYGAAGAKEQAGLVYNAALQMIRGNPLLLEKLKIRESTKRIVRRDGAGFYAVLSADGGLQDGVEPSLAMMDEVHRWKGKQAEALYEVLTAGSISRPDYLAIEISTAGDVYESPLCWREYQRALAIQRGTVKSPRFYGMIYGADEARIKADPDYWKTREARAEANPSHEDNGGFLRDSKIAGMLDELTEQAYKRYHLNIWGQKAEQWMPMDAWLACSAPTRPLIDRPCWLGVDLSRSSDLTAVVALFPDSDGSVDVLPFFWLPKQSIPKIEKRVPIPLVDWVKRGLITTNDDAVIDYELVRSQIHWMRQNFRVQAVCYDPYNATHFIGRLVEDGFTTVEVTQGAGRLNAPMKWLMEKVLKRQMRHAGHEVLNWNADCVSVKTDQNGNIKPVKMNLDREGKRIDGISALICAAFEAMKVAQQDPYSKGARLMSV